MTVLSAKLTIHIPWAASLKDKRQVRRSLIDKVRQKFNVSIAEVDTQDVHQTLTLGLAVVSGEHRHARETLDEVVRFIEGNTEAEIVEVEYAEV
ncbi:DUF503 domain-containing protein [Oscillospiraceae bacterium OttesenSCG-928-F05]|nr:DUF503 domain-containing protein [Oscillospiraceae bacterium OttesenSCG-928-F05]